MMTGRWKKGRKIGKITLERDGEERGT